MSLGGDSYWLRCSTTRLQFKVELHEAQAVKSRDWLRCEIQLEHRSRIGDSIRIREPQDVTRVDRHVELNSQMLGNQKLHGVKRWWWLGRVGGGGGKEVHRVMNRILGFFKCVWFTFICNFIYP